VNLGQLDVPEIERRITNLLASSECWIERNRPEARRLEIRPYLAEIRLRDAALEMDLRVTPNGTARPEEVLQLLGLDAPPGSGGIVERIRVELSDEGLVAPCPAPD
jgi:hypothetical protein